MAESFAQRRNAVNASLRRVRQQYRKADTRGEMLERELDRLILRKTIVSPANVNRIAQLYEAYLGNVRLLDGAMADAYQLATQYA